DLLANVQAGDLHRRVITVVHRDTVPRGRGTRRVGEPGRHTGGRASIAGTGPGGQGGNGGGQAGRGTGQGLRLGHLHVGQVDLSRVGDHDLKGHVGPTGNRARVWPFDLLA